MRSVQAEQEGQKMPSDVSAAEERRPEAQAKTGAIVVCVCRFYAPTQGERSLRVGSGCTGRI